MDQGFILLEHQQGGRVSRLPAWAGPPLVGRDSSGAAKRIMDGRCFRPSCRSGQIRLFRVILRKFIASRPRRTPGPLRNRGVRLSVGPVAECRGDVPGSPVLVSTPLRPEGLGTGQMALRLDRPGRMNHSVAGSPL